MKTKKLTPRNVAPVKRENVATDANAIAPLWLGGEFSYDPFAGEDAE